MVYNIFTFCGVTSTRFQTKDLSNGLSSITCKYYFLLILPLLKLSFIEANPTSIIFTFSISKVDDMSKSL